MSIPISFISKSLSISEKQVSTTINLLEENATVPFISRYRKEMTGGLDEVQIENIQIAFLKLKDIEKRKKTILATISEQGNLSEELKEKIENSTAHAYDLVLNGLELGGGSLRIHQAEMQREVLRTVGLTDNQIDEKFGFLIEALEMGAPPHGGIAFGVDRITMLILGEDSIRETIAFPKNQQAKCLLTNAPSNVSKSQLKELDIEITIDE